MSFLRLAYPPWGMLLNSLCVLETEVGLQATSRKSVAPMNAKELGFKDPRPSSGIFDYVLGVS